MPKKPSKEPNSAKRHPLPDGLIDKLKKDFDFGNGLEISIGSYDPNTNKYSPGYVFSSKLPVLKIGSKSANRDIQVEISSVEQDNTELLHTLFKGVR